MDLSAFFQPLNLDLRVYVEDLPPETLGREIDTNLGSFPEVDLANLVLLGCPIPEEEGQEENAAAAVRQIRRRFYALTAFERDLRMADIGDLKINGDADDACHALGLVLDHLRQQKKTVLIIGGSPSLAFGQYLGMANADQQCEYVHIGPGLALLDSEIVLDSQSVNHRILHHQPGHLFSLGCLGFQRYLVTPSELETMRQHHQEFLRYGEINAHLEEAEPALRQAHIAAINLNCIRKSDNPSSWPPSPGGFNALEICQLARFSGMGYAIQNFSVCGLQPERDREGQGAMLAAMILWYFCQGYLNRFGDLPKPDRSNLKKYSVQLHASIENINFYLHPTTGRWWMEVPHPGSLGENGGQTILVPCTEKDYECARGDDIPQRWWLTYNKLK